jgi:hypothetical protein
MPEAVSEIFPKLNTTISALRGSKKKGKVSLVYSNQYITLDKVDCKNCKLSY